MLSIIENSSIGKEIQIAIALFKGDMQTFYSNINDILNMQKYDNIGEQYNDLKLETVKLINCLEERIIKLTDILTQNHNSIYYLCIMELCSRLDLNEYRNIIQQIEQSSLKDEYMLNELNKLCHIITNDVRIMIYITEDRLKRINEKILL